MSQTGSVWAGLLGLQKGRFELLEVYDPIGQGYIDVALALEELRQEIQKIPTPAEDERITALEAKVQALDESKATKFVALDPLSLNEGTFPNQLSQQGGPTPQSASAINLNGDTAYIQFDGRTHVLGYT